MKNIIFVESYIGADGDIFNIKLFDSFKSLYEQILSYYQTDSYKETNLYELQEKIFNKYGFLRQSTTKAVYGYAYKIGTNNYDKYGYDISTYIVNRIKSLKEYQILLREFNFVD